MYTLGHLIKIQRSERGPEAKKSKSKRRLTMSSFQMCSMEEAAGKKGKEN